MVCSDASKPLAIDQESVNLFRIAIDLIYEFGIDMFLMALVLIFSNVLIA